MPQRGSAMRARRGHQYEKTGPFLRKPADTRCASGMLPLIQKIKFLCPAKASELNMYGR
jgi:hypothetical protein